MDVSISGSGPCVGQASLVSDETRMARAAMAKALQSEAPLPEVGVEYQSACLRDGGLQRITDPSQVSFSYATDIADPAATVPESLRDEMTWEPGEEPEGGDPLARALAAQGPGPDLAKMLADLDPTTISQAALLEAACASERQDRWTQALSNTFVAEADRRSFFGQVAHRELVNELSLRLSVSMRAADLRIQGAVEFVRGAPTVHRGLAEGRIDRAKANIIVYELFGVSEFVSDAVLEKKYEALVAWGENHTHGQLRAKAKKTAAALIPMVYQEHRHEEGRKERSVFVKPDVDGMATLMAYLPAPEAQVAFTVIDRMANTKAADDERTRDHRRADAFSDLFRAMLDADATPLGGLPSAQRSRPHLLISVQPDGGGGSSGPRAARSKTRSAGPPLITLEGFGAITPKIAKRALTGARISFAVADPATGQHRTVVPAPASLTADAAIDAALAGRDMVSRLVDGQGAATNHIAAREHSPPPENGTHRANGPPRELGQSAPDRPRTVDVEPRIGNAIDDRAQELAESGVLAFDGYRPSVELIRRVLLRDSACSFPTCRVPAWRCDLDHLEPFDPALPAIEQTTEDNLQAVCRGHHQLKSMYGWTAQRDPKTGIITWRSPAGDEWESWPEYLEGSC